MMSKLKSILIGAAGAVIGGVGESQVDLVHLDDNSNFEAVVATAVSGVLAFLLAEFKFWLTRRRERRQNAKKHFKK